MTIHKNNFSLYSILFFLLVVLIIFFSDKGQISGDGVLRWEALRTLMEEHRLTSDKYTIVQPLFAVPLYAIGRIVASMENNETEKAKVIRRFTQRFNKFIVLGIAIWFYTFIQSVYNMNRRQASLCTIFLLFGSFLIPHAKDFYSECLWTLLSILSLAQLSQIWGEPIRNVPLKKIFTLGISLLFLIPLNPSLLFVWSGIIVFTMAYRIILPQNFPLKIAKENLPADMLILISSLILGLAFCMIENYIRRESFLNFGYGQEGFSTPFIHGFIGQLFSPSRGIVFFIPTFFLGVLFIRIPQRNRESQQTIFVNLTIGYSLLLVAIYAKWHTWHGAWYWGPRFLLPLSVFGILYWGVSLKKYWKSSLLIKRLLVILGILSFLIYKTGVAINQKHLVACLQQHPYSEQCFWDMSFLPYASFINVGDIFDMLSHRSTVVELGAVLFLWGLITYSKRYECECNVT